MAKLRHCAYYDELMHFIDQFDRVKGAVGSEVSSDNCIVISSIM